MAASTSRLVIEISSEQAKRNAEQLNRELQSIERNGTFATRSMDAMSVATRSLATQMTALVSAGVLISKMDTYTGLQNRLKLVTASQNELKQAMEDTFSIAQATGQAWDSTAQVYQRFADNAKRLGITLEQTASLTDTVAKSISISGGSAASAEAALVQFGQALASGVLRGEEFNSISEQAPALLKAIATGLETNIGQLRAMAAQGQLTTDVVIKSLEKAKVSVDTLFSKTDFTIGQSFQMLNNEVTKFIGEAGKSSGAAKLTADSIQLLAQNLEGLVTGLQVAGAYYLGTFVPAIYASVAAGVVKSKQLVEQTVTQYGLIQAEKAASAQEVVGLEAKLAAAQATRILLVEELKLELQRKKSQISAQGSINSELRMGLLRQQQAQINAELTATENALAAARTRATAASSASLAIGGRLLGILGGPVGLGLTVATLAGSYLLMRDSGLEANAMLNEQSKYAQQSTEELKSLDNAHKSVAKNDLAQKFKEQNEELDRQARLFVNAIGEVAQYNNQMGNGAKVSADLYAIQAEVRSGTLSLSEALNRINKIAMITPEQRAQMAKQIEQYDVLYGTVSNNAKAQKTLGVDVKITGNAAQNAAAQHDMHSKSLDDVANSASKASAELEKYKKQLQGDAFESLYKSGLLDKGYTTSQADAIYKLQQAKGLSVILSQQEIDNTLRTLKLNTDLSKQEKEKTEQIEKQVQLQLLNNKSLENGYRVYQAFLKAGLTSKQSLAFAAQVGREGDFKNSNLFGSHTDNNNGAINVGMLSWQGPRAKELLKDLRSKDLLNVDGTIKQVQEALDIQAKYAVQEFMTKKEYLPTRKAIVSGEEDYSKLSEVSGRNFVRWDFDGKKINANKHKQKESSYYQQLSNLVEMSPDGNSIKIDDYGADLEKLNQLKLQYDEKYYTDSKKRQVDHEKEISDYKLVYSGKELQDKVEQSNKQFEAENNLAKLQFESQVQGWRWIGEERIKNQATVDKAVIDATRSITDQQKVLAKASIDDQAKYEIEAYRRTQELKLLEFRAMLYAQVGDAQKAAMESKAQATLNPNQLGNWQLQNQFSDSMSGAWDSWQSSQKSINQIGDNGQYLNDANTRHKMLLEAEQAYQDQLKAIRDKGASDEMLLIRSQHDNQLQLYSSLLSSASTTWGNMTQMVKDARGENSKTFKAMFLAQQTMAIAQQVINTELAAGATTAQTGIFGLPAATAIRAIGYASVGLIAAQTIAGFSTGGHVRGSGTETSDSIPALLSDNEYVIKAKSVRSLGVDTLDYINRMGELPVKRASGGSVGVTSSYIVDRYKSDSGFKVTINNYGNDEVQTSQDADGNLMFTIGKMLDQKIDSGVDRGIQRNLRQGYPLSNAIKGK